MTYPLELDSPEDAVASDLAFRQWKLGDMSIEWMIGDQKDDDLARRIDVVTQIQMEAIRYAHEKFPDRFDDIVQAVMFRMRVYADKEIEEKRS